MTPEQQNKAIAEFLGWYDVTIERKIGVGGWPPDSETWEIVPDYASDLNAIHEAEKKMTAKQRLKHLDITVSLVYRQDGPTASCFYATAAQRAEALIKTLGKWAEPQP